MKKHTYRLLISISVPLLCICSSEPLMAQTIDRQVISTVGENFQTANGSLVFTMGEIAVETFKRDVQLSQGFQQEWVVITSIASETADPLDVLVYPNPTKGILNMESESEAQIFLYDLSGKLKITSSKPSGTGQIEMGDFPAGTYVLEVVDEAGRKRVLKIEKVE